MFRGRITHALLRTLDHAASALERSPQAPAHILLGQSGEEAAYFHLRKLGYTVVARNFRVPYRKGEIDLVAWERDVLCIVEVKTRSSDEVAAAEAALDTDKQRELRGMARAYIRRLREEPTIRFDLVTVYYRRDLAEPEIRLYKGVFSQSL